MKSGERCCLLVDKKTGLKLYHPNLYSLTQIRNSSLSVAAIEAALSAINVVLTFFDERKIDIESRILQRDFLQAHELDAIRDYCQFNFSSGKYIKAENISNVLGLFSKKIVKTQHTGAKNQYVRLTNIAKYLSWLAGYLLSRSMDKNLSNAIQSMEKGLLARRHLGRNRNQLTSSKHGLSEFQQQILKQVVDPESEINPFDNEDVKVRNQLIIYLLYYLGIRSGELLNIRMRDIDWDRHHIVIHRRADEVDDPRLDQPLVKTLDRRLPLKPTLIEILRRYILEYRKKIPNARKHDFLFVTHKPGPTQGQPISRSSYTAIVKRIANQHPELSGMHGHLLRHTWNDRLSNLLDEESNQPGRKRTSEAEEEKIRSDQMGWKEGSGTAATYNKRYIEKKGREASLKLQEGKIILPENFKDG